MTSTTRFPYTDFLRALEQSSESGAENLDAWLSSLPAGALPAANGAEVRAKASASLILLLKARKATLQAAFDTELAADELRRYQKYVKPGKPSAHIVQLRQKQAAARQATSLSKQALIKAAAAFVRDAGIEVPERTTIDVFIIDWIDANVPKDAAK